jgi:hypothetical protein
VNCLFSVRSSVKNITVLADTEQDARWVYLKGDLAASLTFYQKCFFKICYYIWKLVTMYSKPLDPHRHLSNIKASLWTVSNILSYRPSNFMHIV